MGVPMDYDSPVIRIKGVGEKTEQLFHKLNIYTVGDLVRQFPGNYEEMKEPVSINAALPGDVCAIHAKVKGIPNIKKVRNLTIMNVVVQDGSGSLLLTFFNMPFLKNILKNGSCFIFRGLVQNHNGTRLMEQPKMFQESDYREKQKFIQPCYSLTKGLSNQTFQKAVKQALSFLLEEEEYYPSDICTLYGLMTYKEAIANIHFPENFKTLAAARKRLVFDEFFDFIISMRINKDAVGRLLNEYQMCEVPDTDRLLMQLPYRLTAAQEKVWQEINGDMAGEYCMNRLIQGDVGSGKTIVAVLSLLACACNGYQGALMAPTEVLAIQHYTSIQEITDRYKLPFHIVLLVGSMTTKEKRTAYEKIENGTANLVIGTHALIQDPVQFKSLALVVTDEQHRFGVRQREHLAGKGRNPHVLVMSATPIPRTLAIILYGDLHISIIDELPANRLPIKNCVVNTGYRRKAYEFITREAAAGHQIYIICPMVSPGEMEALENVTEYTQKLKAQLPPEVRVSMLHGKMRPGDKNRIMEEFVNHKIDILVSTTVIEVGINVPNATVMMVENAERFGLAGLHQLRGRVGRGDAQSYCIFISSNEKKETMERLSILNHSNDGFHIASEDLKLRGPGDFFGIRQSGDFAFRIGDIYTDAAILKEAQEAVDFILKDDGISRYPLLSKHLQSSFSNSVDFRSI